MQFIIEKTEKNALHFFLIDSENIKSASHDYLREIS